MKTLARNLFLLLLASCLAGCNELGALTPREATRQSVSWQGDIRNGAQILGEYRLPDGKSLVVFSFTPDMEDGKPMTGLGYSLLKRSRIGLWQEINRGTYVQQALDLAGEWIDFNIANQPGEVATVFGRTVDTGVSEIVAVYDDGRNKSDRDMSNGFAFFVDDGSYPIALRVVGKDGKDLETVELDLVESIAMQTLTQFFSYLHDGLYAEAALLYGGTYQVLADMNNLIDPTDHESLWENACKINGFQCLYVESIGPKEQVAPDEFSFLVGFMDDEGNSFRQGACCGEEVAAPQGEFEFRVKKAQNGQFMVMDLPVYIP